MITIGIDLMGSETAPKELFLGCLELMKRTHKGVHFLFIGTFELFASDALLFTPGENFSFFPVNCFIAMEEDPLVAIRKKKDSSIYQGVTLLKEKKIDAFVCPGHTGALVGVSKLLLPPLPKISRPALLALMPSQKEPLAVLDVGANIQYTADQLVQWAYLGAIFQFVRTEKKPLVGLLNIGQEAKKGSPEHRKAYDKLRKLQELGNPLFDFAGNVEGKEVFEGKIDVLLTDGFTGNIFLKTAEGIATLAIDKLEKKLSSLASSEFSQNLKDVKEYLHYSYYPGALLLGRKGVIVKCHSYSTKDAFAKAVEGTISFVEKDLLGIFESLL